MSLSQCDARQTCVLCKGFYDIVVVFASKDCIAWEYDKKWKILQRFKLKRTGEKQTLYNFLLQITS